MSHLSTPDDHSATEVQLIAFQAFQKELSVLGIAPKYIHICASGGLFNAASYDIPVGNLARTGIAYF
jgi:alanine racemase